MSRDTRRTDDAITRRFWLPPARTAPGLPAKVARLDAFNRLPHVRRLRRLVNLMAAVESAARDVLRRDQGKLTAAQRADLRRIVRALTRQALGSDLPLTRADYAAELALVARLTRGE